MDKLQTLLADYNRKFIKEEFRNSWSKKYCETPFPKYWHEVFKVSETLDRNLRVLEIGAGQGDVTSIFCYLGFKKILSFERDANNATIAKEKIKFLFSSDSIIRNEQFPTSEKFNSDVLVLVNCVYADGINNKEDYKDNIKSIFSMAGCPQVFFLEVIDSEYDITDEKFPFHVRLSKKDIVELFPSTAIKGIRTFQYPRNKKTKTLYIIQRHL